MVQALEAFFDEPAEEAVRELWRRLDSAGIPSLASRGKGRPHVTFAVAGGIPARSRAELASELRLLSLPTIWLYTLGTFPTTETQLVLTAVVDAELLAVHSAIHEVLANRAKNPSAYYMPGAWVPHCTLSREIDTASLASAMSTLHPIRPIKARVREIGITDTATGEVDSLLVR
ncbi:2'-5' RNA ligase superfamily protein [Tamaricihabitans halophyticus]|uniref:2'-5' RNA ligase superfamily protein n=1 Tax=Tamaricihabitans halophyticus TaxID=1262583 RepID=A0A4R2R484_9PSEU|nr:2'-5' RNA ligase family protein [Tamaricihabitans halophyticus]TCP56704.1 2'-5' RNA ligase superfamily protein [Tamaricihabitans halophyticus]